VIKRDFLLQALDLEIRLAAGPRPNFDPVLADFLRQSWTDLQASCAQSGSLLQSACLDDDPPWLYRLAFATKGYVRASIDEPVETVERHVFALRFLPDYLRHANRFEMLSMVAPRQPAPWHPNLCGMTGAVCVEIYPGEPLAEICRSLHDLLRWRLRQLDERDALNKPACAWGRQNVSQPIDDRPLFGRRLQIQFEPAGEVP
jgi:hypothetical protein